MKTALLLAVALLLALSISGCGKKGELAPPDNQAREYPRIYPPPR